MNVWEQHILYKRRDDDTWVKADPIEEQRIRTQTMTGELILSVFVAPNPVALNNPIAPDAPDWLLFQSISPADGGDEVARLCFARTGSLISAATYAQWELQSMNHPNAEETALRLTLNAIDLKRQALSTEEQVDTDQELIREAESAGLKKVRRAGSLWIVNNEHRSLTTSELQRRIERVNESRCAYL